MSGTNDESKQVVPVEPNSVMAVNLLLEPDAAMIERSKENNARLLAVFPQGSRWMKRIIRTSRCCSASFAQRTSTMSMQPPGRCSPAPR